MGLRQLLKRWSESRDLQPPSGEGLTFPNTDCTWKIEADGRASLLVTRQFLFAHDPGPTELCDILFSTQEFGFEQLEYRSPDAEAADVENAGQKTTVFWRPSQGSVLANVPYQHTYSCGLPKVLSPDYKEFTIASRAPVTRYRLEIVSCRPLGDVICYKARPGQSVWNAEDIYEQAKTARLRGAPPPRKIDEQRWEVTIENLQPGENYFVVLKFAEPVPGSIRPRLVVVVPAINGDVDSWRPLIARLKQEEALAETCWKVLNTEKRWNSLARADQLARELRAKIDQAWRAYGPFEDIILVGHSMGGLLVRQAYLMACGVDTDVTQQSEWAERVSRLILFAAINRGVDPARKWIWRLTAWLFRVLPIFQRILVWDLLRGSDFITNLRIQWIRYFASLQGREPIVVQLLGTRDDVVAREDSVDVEQFPNAYAIEVASGTHDNLFHLEGIEDADERYAVLRDAFVHVHPRRAENIKVCGASQIVFVLHGIRADNRTWVQQTIDAIKTQWPAVQAIGPRYGYFSALRFAIPVTRRRNLEWFRDAYTEALAHNPQASFSFIGHSNGTYIFGECLRAIPGMRFKRAVLVGSVLPSDYDWENRSKRKQLEQLRVDGSSHDWPVGWLCSLLRGAGMRDVGTGGFEGFTRLNGVNKSEYFWYKGGHSAPLATANLSSLATFAVTGSDVKPRSEDMCGGEGWFALISRALRLLAPVLVAALLVGYVWLLWTNPLSAVISLAAFLAVIVLLDII